MNKTNLIALILVLLVGIAELCVICNAICKIDPKATPKAEVTVTQEDESNVDMLVIMGTWWLLSQNGMNHTW